MPNIVEIDPNIGNRFRRLFHLVASIYSI